MLSKQATNPSSRRSREMSSAGGCAQQALETSLGEELSLLCFPEFPQVIAAPLVVISTNFLSLCPPVTPRTHTAASPLWAFGWAVPPACTALPTLPDSAHPLLGCSFCGWQGGVVVKGLGSGSEILWPGLPSRLSCQKLCDPG